MNDAFESFEHVGMMCELHQDYEPMSPEDWDTLGTLVVLPDTQLARSYNIGQAAESDESEAFDRGGSRLVIRYMRLTQGVFAVPFRFEDYGSSGARMYDVDLDEERPTGYLMTSHSRVNELCGEGAEYHTREWIEKALRGELETWDAYFKGEVCGYVVRDLAGDVVDSCWGFYPGKPTSQDPFGLEYVREEARSAAESEQEERDRAANQDIATVPA